MQRSKSVSDIDFVSYISSESLFQKYMEAFLEENTRINLTSIRNPKEFLVKHIEDSIKPLYLSAFYNHAYFEFPRKFLDIGTGGGFPLVPVAIDLHLSERSSSVYYGMDSIGKKLKAVQRILERIALSGICFLNGRAEEYGRENNYRESFDLVTTRAVADLSVVLEYSSPFLKPGGYVVIYKSADIFDEFKSAENAARELSLACVEQIFFQLSNDMGSRSLTVYRKEGHISDLYPRGNAFIRKRPIV